MKDEISRRTALSLVGVAALGLALPATLLTATDAEAQTVGMTVVRIDGPDAATVVTRDGQDVRTAATCGVATPPPQPPPRPRLAAAARHRNRVRSVSLVLSSPRRAASDP